MADQGFFLPACIVEGRKEDDLSPIVQDTPATVWVSGAQAIGTGKILPTILHRKLHHLREELYQYTSADLSPPPCSFIHFGASP